MAKRTIAGKIFGKKPSKRAGQSLRGGRHSARRKWSDDETVRASKDSGAGVMREVVGGKGKKQQASPAAQRKRKGEGQQAADLKQPAAGSVGKGAEQADAGLPSSKVAAKQASDFDKAISKKEKQLENYKSKRDSLTGKAKIKFIAESKVRIDALKASIKDMKSRGGPGGRSKIKYKSDGGSLRTVNKKKNPGLAKLPTPVRNKMGFAKEGGQVISKKSGGKVNMGFGDSLVRQGYDNN
jgi:hypothetical protein